MDEKNALDKLHDAQRWLQEFITRINEQDNRGTAIPYYYELSTFSNKRVEYGRTVFFTEKAAEEYIRANSHNLPDNVCIYLNWGGRNPEMRKLLKNIGIICGVPYERK